jgi:hypothetical protein
MKRLILFLAVVLWPLAAAADYRDEIALDLALVTIQANTPLPTPTPDVCPQCGGTGWITHGDGHKTKCPCQDGAEPQGILGIKDAAEAVKKTCEKTNRVIDGFMAEGLDIHIAPPGPKKPVTTSKSHKKPAPRPSSCESGQCYERPVLFPRLRRWR